MPAEFYKPKDLGTANISVNQTGKLFKFRSVNGVFLPEAVIRFSYSGIQQHALSIGSGMTIVGSNVIGVSKELHCTLNGSDFSSHLGKTLKAECINFFRIGDIEMEFNLQIK